MDLHIGHQLFCWFFFEYQILYTQYYSISFLPFFYFFLFLSTCLFISSCAFFNAASASSCAFFNTILASSYTFFIFSANFIVFSTFSFLIISVSRLLTMDLTFMFHLSFYFIFLFLEQLRLGFISHAVTSVTS